MSAVIVTVLFFILQQFQLLMLYGVNPNLVFVVLVFFAFRENGFRRLFILFAVTAVLSAVFAPVWIMQFVFLFLTVFLLKFLKSFMTGSRLPDFLAGIFFGTFLFYLFAGFFKFEISYVLIFKEAVYNIFVGAAVWFMIPEKNA